MRVGTCVLYKISKKYIFLTLLNDLQPFQAPKTLNFLRTHVRWFWCVIIEKIFTLIMFIYFFIAWLRYAAQAGKKCNQICLNLYFDGEW